VSGRKRNDEIAMDEGRHIRRHEQTAVRRAREQLDGALDLDDVFDKRGYELDPECLSQRISRTQVVVIEGRGLGIDHKSDAREALRDVSGLTI
jgi:hypothetical protein